MADQSQRPAAKRDQYSTDITSRIKSLAVSATQFESCDSDLGQQRAVLVCCDKSTIKWGPRWLRQGGLQVTCSNEPDNALDLARTERPHVIVIEAGLKDRNGVPLMEVFDDAVDVSIPIIALCLTSKDYTTAMAAQTYDVIRKPLDWQLVSKRAAQAAAANAIHAQLDEVAKSLSQALTVADDARQQLRSRESFEPVTGLPNKKKFVDLLKRSMQAVDRDGTALAVLVIGFNRFRLVIEALGQQGADLVLGKVGSLLNDCLHDAGTAQQNTPGLKTTAAGVIDASRFGILLTCSPQAAELLVLQGQLENILARPVEVSGQTIYLSACIGAALYPKDAQDVDQLLQRADNAMLDVRSRGGGFKFYCAETDAAAARKLRLEHLLHEAVESGELKLAYQPLTETQSGRITGAEALLRWQRPDHSYIPPDEFVPIAEESGLMIRIGTFVLDQACQQLKAWQLDGVPVTHMCVNVSKRQLMNGDFVATVKAVLDRHELDPACVELELSERGVLSGDLEVIKQLHGLKKLGVKLSIDDFGTGESAMGYLKELPIDVVKIDRSYISGLIDNHKDAAITSAMIVLGQKLDLKVVAEGVENPAQLAMLRVMGCDEYQGFLVSPAVPATEFPELVDRAARNPR